MYIRINYEDNQEEITDSYASKKEVVEDGERYYHEHFTMDEDYDENFEIKSFGQSLDFWAANGYEIYKSINSHICKQVCVPRQRGV